MKAFRLTNENWTDSFEKWNKIIKILAVDSPDKEDLYDALDLRCGYCDQYYDPDTNTSGCAECHLFSRKVCQNNRRTMLGTLSKRAYWIVACATRSQLETKSDLKKIRDAAKRILTAIEKDRPGGR